MGLAVADKSQAERCSLEFIHVVFACDATYAKRLSPLLRSIIRNSSDAGKLRFHLISSDLPKRLIDRLRRISPRLSYIELEQEAFSDVPCPEVLPYVTKATYYRFMIGQCLPEVDRVIYVDADTCFLRPIEELWGVGLEGAIIGAVANESQRAKSKDGSNLGFDPDQFYFNAGMLVIDLVRWRKENVESKLWDNLYKFGGTLRFADQDVLNETLKTQVKELPKAFNYQVEIRREFEGYCDVEPVMLHFVGRGKPWSARWVHPAQRTYMRFASRFARFQLAIMRALICLVDYENADRFVCVRIFRIPLYKYRKKFAKKKGLYQITHYCLWVPVKRSVQSKSKIS